MIPLTFLYDEYIDRPKFTEQKKKNPFEYIVPSPTSGVGTTRQLESSTMTLKRLKNIVFREQVSFTIS